MKDNGGKSALDYFLFFSISPQFYLTPVQNQKAFNCF